MPQTVGSAFDQFRKNVVDLDSEDTKKARESQDYLFDQIKRLARNNSNFPKIESGNPFMNFGSFARKTKIRPLDDIDFLVILDRSNTAVEINSLYPYTYNLKFIKPSIYFASTLPSMTLEQFADSSGYINSTRLLNRIKVDLSSVTNYKEADSHKMESAVTFKLKSYSWNYDIVPAIRVYDIFGNTAYFLIPDGKGYWIATNPRLDNFSTTAVNRKYEGSFLGILRLLKYWNGIPYHKQRLPSYYFETLVIKVFERIPRISNLPQAVKVFFDICPFYLKLPCPDPKNLGPNLDAKVDELCKENVIKAMKSASISAEEALRYESSSNHKYAIERWQRIFGYKFPNYG
jgi:hypothetical protein